ncbi:uncharacterized protein CG32395 [Drosophila eugracilis]|uniref:uncharacterized protein CG32395 n=1 Tax=Drosophila eugracilis TaxID=29029 RepID=UPI001BDB468E|nr:uncharacterized protein CG32395 [Drosophila eugracilis]
MREVNLLNRLARQFLFLIVLLTQMCGVTTFVYSSKAQGFRQSGILRLYSSLILSLVAFVLVINISKMFDKLQVVWPYLVGSIVMLVVRVQGFMDSSDIVELLNEILEILRQVKVMARNPNIFRLRHFMLLLLTLQNLLRSLTMLIGFKKFSEEAYDTLANTILMLILLGVLLSFLLQITLNICLFVVLIAVYNELHRDIQRISNDMDKLGASQVLESGQFLVLVEQLQRITERVIRLRWKVYNLTLRIIRHFRFYWLCAITYGLIPFLGFTAIDHHGFYYLTVSALNIIFQCTIFKILSGESRISRSFSSFQLGNYLKEIDRIIEELLHQEIRTTIQVTIYGITLDTRFLMKLLSISAFWVLVNRQGYLHLHCTH